MARYELDPADYGRIRFAVSPLTELGCSLRMLKSPSSYPLQAGWYDRVWPLRDQLPLDVLAALIGTQFDTPDFFNPRTDVAHDIDAQLAHLRAQPAVRLAADAERSLGPLPPELARAGRALPQLLGDALQAYWRLAFAPHWPRLRAVLDADVATRARQVISAGVIETLNGCGPGIHAYEDTIEADVLGHDQPLRLQTRGRPLCLVPSLFTLRSSVPIADDGDPMLLYPAAGQRGMWQDRESAPHTVRLLGGTRAAYLGALASPRSSTDLAQEFGVTPSAVNQALRAMIEQGLLRPHREGRHVLYERTTLGDQLIEAG